MKWVKTSWTNGIFWRKKFNQMPLTYEIADVPLYMRTYFLVIICYQYHGPGVEYPP